MQKWIHLYIGFVVMLLGTMAFAEEKKIPPTISTSDFDYTFLNEFVIPGYTAKILKMDSPIGIYKRKGSSYGNSVDSIEAFFESSETKLSAQEESILAERERLLALIDGMRADQPEASNQADTDTETELEAEAEVEIREPKLDWAEYTACAEKVLPELFRSIRLEREISEAGSILEKRKLETLARRIQARLAETRATMLSGGAAVPYGMYCGMHLSKRWISDQTKRLEQVKLMQTLLKASADDRRRVLDAFVLFNDTSLDESVRGLHREIWRRLSISIVFKNKTIPESDLLEEIRVALTRTIENEDEDADFAGVSITPPELAPILTRGQEILSERI